MQWANSISLAVSIQPNLLCEDLFLFAFPFKHHLYVRQLVSTTCFMFFLKLNLETSEITIWMLFKKKSLSYKLNMFLMLLCKWFWLLFGAWRVEPGESLFISVKCESSCTVEVWVLARASDPTAFVLFLCGNWIYGVLWILWKVITSSVKQYKPSLEAWTFSSLIIPSTCQATAWGAKVAS